MKKSVELLKSEPTEKNFEKVLKFYEGSDQLERAKKGFVLDPVYWDSLIQLILFLDPVLNRKVNCWWYSTRIEHGTMEWNDSCGWYYEEDPNNPDEYIDSMNDKLYVPAANDNYNEISNKELSNLIGHSRKLKKLLSFLNE